MSDPQKLEEVKAAKAKYDETVAKVLTKIPERRADFVNTSGIAHRPGLHPSRHGGFRLSAAIGDAGPISLHPGGAAHRLPRAALDHAAIRRIWLRRKKPIGAITICCSRARPDSRWPSTCRRSWATTPTMAWRKARWGSAAHPSRRLRIWRFCSAASR